jgi:TolB protein
VSAVVSVANRPAPTRATSAATPALDQFPAWSNDGHQLTFTSARDAGQADIYTLDIDSGAVRRLTSDPALDSQSEWTPQAILRP